MALSATTYLADGANQLFDEWLVLLRDLGFELEGSPGGDRPLDAALVFACGLLSIQSIYDGAQREIVARPVFDGETEAVYRSVIIGQKDHAIGSLDQASGLRLAVNEYGSWSGWHCLKHHVRRAGLPADVVGDHVMTGGHMLSINAVLDGEADIASIDSSVWNYRAALDPSCAQLEILDTTVDWPAPPISISTTLPNATRDELALAILSLDGIEPAAIADYADMLSEFHLPWGPAA